MKLSFRVRKFRNYGFAYIIYIFFELFLNVN